VKSTNRILKAVFVNAPQLIAVSLYAQYYSYIHEHIDPDPEADPSKSGTSKLSTSRNASLMGASAARKEAYTQDLALQLRLYMTAYMLSFLTNTVLQGVGDNLAMGAPSDNNLLVQAVVVTPQGFIWALVYMRFAPNSLFSAYLSVAAKFFDSRGNHSMAEKFKKMRDKSKQTKSTTSEPGVIRRFLNGLYLFMQSFLMLPVAIWVWTPMEFLGEQLSHRGWIFFGLCVWGTATVFPVYFFSLQTVGAASWQYSAAAQIYCLLVISISAWAVWNNRFAHYLVMIEGPVRKVGIFSGIGQGYRLNSIRNCMGLITLSIEFYQVYGFTWTTAKMKDQYALNETLAEMETIEDIPAMCMGLLNNITGNFTDCSNATDLTTGAMCNAISGCEYAAEIPAPEKDLKSVLQELAKFWGVIGAVGGWAILYSLPACITTSSIGNQQLAFNLMEKYRKYLWFMSGAGFLTILKTLMKVIFCLDDPLGNLNAAGEIRQVVLTDYTLECWSPKHLRMTAISLIALILFFPSASLTCLFRYGDEDDRQLPCCKPTNACCFKNTPGMEKGMRLGGEDTRWIHIWKRAEYMVKGVWVFTGYKFSTYGLTIPPLAFLCAGSFCIAWMNWFMAPANLSYVGRCKLNVHVCNVWTTSTCLWAITTENTDQTKHLIILFAGWIFVWIAIWGYEIFKYNKVRTALSDHNSNEAQGWRR
jgi:hypothetical protein